MANKEDNDYHLEAWLFPDIHGVGPHKETGREQDDMQPPGTLIQVRPCEGGSLAMSHGR